MKVKGRIKAKPDLPVARKASEAHWGSFDGVQTDWWAEVWCLDCSPHRFDEDQDESMDGTLGTIRRWRFCYTRELM